MREQVEREAALERRCTELVENATDIVYTHDLASHFTSVNPAAERLLGYTREEALRLNLAQVVAPEHLERVRQQTSEKLAHGAATTYELEVLTKSGWRVWLEVGTRLLRPEGRPVEVQGIARDITERKQAEAALREREEKFRSVIQTATDAIILANERGEIVSWNAGAQSMFQYAAVEVVGKPFTLLMPELYREAHLAGLARLAATGERRVMGKVLELHGLRRDNTEFSIELALGNWLAPTGRFFSAVVRDITARKQAEAALRETEERFRALIEQSHDGVTLLSAEGAVLYDSPSVARMLGYSAAERVGRRVVEFAHPEERAGLAESLAQFAQRPGAVAAAQLRFLRKDGTQVWLESVRTNLLHEPAVQAIVVNYRDITERKRAEEALREEASFRSTVLERTTQGLCVCHAIAEPPDVAFTVWNGRMTEITGYTLEQINRLGWYQMLYPDPEIRARAVERMARMRTGNDLVDEEWEITRADGQKRMLAISTRILPSNDNCPHVLALMQDITERKRAEEAVRESEERYRGIFDESVAAIYVFDSNKNFINANQAGLDLLGYSREELLHLSISDVDADPVAVLPAHQQLLSGGRLINYEHRLRRKDGTIVTVLNNSRPLTDLHGNVVGMLSTLIDIAERKRAAEALRASEEKYRLIVDHIGEIVLVSIWPKTPVFWSGVKK